MTYLIDDIQETDYIHLVPCKSTVEHVEGIK